MSRVVRNGDPSLCFSSVAEVRDYLLAKVEKSLAGRIGVEQEIFVTSSSGTPAAFAQIEALLRHMASLLPGADLLREGEAVVGLSIAGLGDVCLEPGGQVELSSAPVSGLPELEACQRTLYAALATAASVQGLVLQGGGHAPAFVGAPLVPRSRFSAYADYCAAAHGVKKAEALLGTMKSCAGLQVNLDPMGDDFHKIYRALMALELAGCFHELSQRHERFAKTYAPLFPRQVTPLFNAVAARDNRDLIRMVVDRLLSLHMPFVPDPENVEGFLSSAVVYGKTPTVGDLLRKGVLTSGLLDNALSLQMTMPNLRRHGVVETRNPDTPQDIAGVMEVAARYHRAAYDVETREALLAILSVCVPDNLAAAYASRFVLSRSEMMALPLGAGMTVAGLIDGVNKAVSRPQPAVQEVSSRLPVSGLARR